VIILWAVTGAVLLLALALAGLTLRLSQGITNLLQPTAFYALMTFHGIGMVGVALLVVAALFWYIMSKSLPLSPAVMHVMYVLSLVGVLLITVSCVVGFGTGWTFLYPLPSTPGPLPGWPTWAAGLFLIGLALVVVAYLLWCLDFLRAGISRFGGVGRLLGVDILLGKVEPGPETTDPAIIAGTVVAVGGVAAALPGALVVVLMLINLFTGWTFSALLAKNLIFFAGHMLVNVQIYTGAGIIYALLPGYVGRSWKASRVLVFAWLVALMFVMLAFFHHLYQDFAQPEGLQVVGEIASFGVAFPPIVVTILSGIMLVYRSGMRWTTAPIYLYAALAGWAIGGWGAEMGDATPLANQFFHNTVWVPAHFHTYMALGVIPFILGAVYHVMPEITGRQMSERLGRLAATLVLAGGWVLVLLWYAEGTLSQPRRYPITLPSLEDLSRAAAGAAVVVAIGALLIFFDFGRTMLGPRGARASRTLPAGYASPSA
jgi:cytochrome c oxidase subunit 1